jgi:hypothetical protein
MKEYKIPVSFCIDIKSIKFLSLHKRKNLVINTKKEKSQ